MSSGCFRLSAEHHGLAMVSNERDARRKAQSAEGARLQIAKITPSKGVLRYAGEVSEERPTVTHANGKQARI